MKEFYQFLNLLGLPVNESSDPIIIFLCAILIFGILGLLCVFNIMIYFIVLYIFQDENRLVKINNKLPSWGVSILNIYKNTRIYYLIIEVIFLLFCLCSIIGYIIWFIHGVT